MIFIDTGAFFSRSFAPDAHHARTVALWPKLARERIFTSGLVLCETAELLSRKATAELAAENLRKIHHSPSLTILRPTREDELAALDLMVKYADQPIGFADCVSFVLMKQNRIRRAFSFDRHFEAAGFALWPG